MQIVKVKNNLLDLKKPPVPLVETIEHLKAISQLTENEWLDLIGLTWPKYQQFRIGTLTLSDQTLNNICEYFKITANQLLTGHFDFQGVAVSLESVGPAVSDYYLSAAYSTRRTTITSIEYLEKAFGWRLKQDILKHFKIKESALINPFEKVSVRLIIQICDYLRRRQFSSDNFYHMGTYSTVGNRDSLLDRTFKQLDNLPDLFDLLINQMTPLFEVNSTFKYTQLNKFEGIMIMKSVPEVANELGMDRLGSPEICELKRGICASAPSYMGLPYATVTHTTCEHRGDDACRFHIDTRPCFFQN